MPAGRVHPRVSQVPQRPGAGPLAEYAAAGWRITEGGWPDTGQVIGRCARCAGPALVYGRGGNPLCPECRTGAG